MNDFDPLENELAALRPREPSVELKRRIAARLGTASLSQHQERRSIWRAGAMVGGLLAASLAAVVAWQGGGPTTEEIPVAALELDVATTFDESLPSLWSYRRTLSRQTQPVNRLLDRHASRRRELGSSAPAFVVARSSFDLDSLTGEL